MNPSIKLLLFLLIFALKSFAQKPNLIVKDDLPTYHFYDENIKLKFEAKAQVCESLATGDFYTFNQKTNKASNKNEFELKFYDKNGKSSNNLEYEIINKLLFVSKKNTPKNYKCVIDLSGKLRFDFGFIEIKNQKYLVRYKTHKTKIDKENPDIYSITYDGSLGRRQNRFGSKIPNYYKGKYHQLINYEKVNRNGYSIFYTENIKEKPETLKILDNAYRNLFNDKRNKFLKINAVKIKNELYFIVQVDYSNYGILNINGNWLIEPKYKSLTFLENIISCSTQYHGKYEIFDLKTYKFIAFEKEEKQLNEHHIYNSYRVQNFKKLDKKFALSGQQFFSYGKKVDLKSLTYDKKNYSDNYFNEIWYDSKTKLFDNVFALQEKDKFLLKNSLNQNINDNKFEELEIIHFGRFGYLKCKQQIGLEKHYYFKSNGAPIFTNYDFVQPIQKNLLTAHNIAKELKNNLSAIKYGNEKIGIVDTLGNEIIPCVYDFIAAFNFNKKLFLVKQNNKYGVIDSLNNFIVEPNFEFPSDIYNLRNSSKNLNKMAKGRLDTLNKIQKIVDDIKIDSLKIENYTEYDLNNNKYVLLSFKSLKNQKYDALLDLNGNFIIKPNYNELRIYNEITCWKNGKLKNKFNYLTYKYKFESDIEIRSSNYYLLENGLSFFLKKEKRKQLKNPEKVGVKLIEGKKMFHNDAEIYNFLGEKLTNKNYQKIDYKFRNGLLKAEKSNGKIIWDKTENKIFAKFENAKYISIDTFANNLRVTNFKNLHGILNFQLDTILKVKYKKIQKFDFGYVIDTGIFDLNFKPIYLFEAHISLNIYKARLEKNYSYELKPKSNGINFRTGNNVNTFLIDKNFQFYDVVTEKMLLIEEVKKRLQPYKVYEKDKRFVVVDSFNNHQLLKNAASNNFKHYYKLIDNVEKTLIDFSCRQEVKFTNEGNLVIKNINDVDYLGTRDLTILNHKAQVVYFNKVINFGNYIDGFISIELRNNDLLVLNSYGKKDKTKTAIKIFSNKPQFARSERFDSYISYPNSTSIRSVTGEFKNIYTYKNVNGIKLSEYFKNVINEPILDIDLTPGKKSKYNNLYYFKCFSKAYSKYVSSRHDYYYKPKLESYFKIVKN